MRTAWASSSKPYVPAARMSDDERKQTELAAVSAPTPAQHHLHLPCHVWSRLRQAGFIRD